MSEKDEAAHQKPHIGLSMPAGAQGIVHSSKRRAYAMAGVWRDFFGVAVWLRDESWRWRNCRERLAEMRCALACLLHCYITVEACVNAYGSWFLVAANAPISNKTAEKVERLDTGTKLLVYPRLFAGASVFEAGSEPYQSFEVLKRMRDSFVVHPKARMREDLGIDVDSEGRTSLADAERAVSALSGLEEWNREPRCSADGATWGCDVVKAIAEKLSTAGGPIFDLTIFDLPIFTQSR